LRSLLAEAFEDIQSRLTLAPIDLFLTAGKGQQIYR